MKATYRIFILLVLLFFLAGLATVSAKDEYTRTINKQFPVKTGDKLAVDNRFGKVHCNNWDKDEVTIEVNITVTARNEEEAGKFFSHIGIDISASAGVIYAKTTLNDNHNSTGNFNIDYEINMPSYLDLNITNKFGDIFVNELAGKATLEVSYGDLDVNKLLNSDNLVQVKFGKARIGWIKGAVVTLAYSRFDLDYAGSIRLNSKYSDLDAGQIISLNFDFEGGKMEVTNTSIFESRCKFSDISIGRVEKSLSLDIQYGDCTVDEVPADFSTIRIRNRFGQVTVGINSEASYNLDATLEFCDLDFPKSKARLTESNADVTSKTYKGVVGQDQHTKSTVTIDSQYGGVSLE